MVALLSQPDSMAMGSPFATSTSIEGARDTFMEGCLGTQQDATLYEPGLDGHRGEGGKYRWLLLLGQEDSWDDSSSGSITVLLCHR